MQYDSINLNSHQIVTTAVYMQYDSINLNSHQKVRGCAEMFASPVILCSSNQSIWFDPSSCHVGGWEKFFI